MALRIYTKTGDKGTTALLGGTRVSKGSLRITAYGSIDTLNSYVGWVADLQEEKKVQELLRKVQDRLFTTGSLLAADPDKELSMKLPELQQEDILQLEKAMDDITAVLPPLRSFILPGGHVAISACHIARCHCREAERMCVALQEAEENIPQLVVPYLNRLSDYLFMLARYTAMRLNVQEISWKPKSD